MQARMAEFCKATRRGRRVAEVEFDLVPLAASQVMARERPL